ncbi:MAG: hypothetical protein NZT92_08565 [Abditibacteriales bacterium]|nr:hypothetical protein [Abditibacteriales bacterium]MDW8365437.1 hypothetical protein [Abditibacteriales bacterium]
MSPMAPEEKKKLYILLGLIGVLIVVVLVVLRPFGGSGGDMTSSLTPASGSGSTSGTSGFGGGMGSTGTAPAMDPTGSGAPGMMPPGGGMPTGADMSGASGTPSATPTGGSGQQPTATRRRGPRERFRADPMEPFQQQLPPSTLAPVISTARAPWTGQGLEGLPRISLADFNPPPAVPGERPPNIPRDEASGPAPDPNKRLAGMMMTQSNMLWVIMEAIEETGVKYYVLKPGDIVQLRDGSFQVVRFERFKEKTDNKENVRIVLKDLGTGSHKLIDLRPSSQPQQGQMGGGMMGGGMGMPGMPGMGGMGMPGMPGIPGMGGGRREES